MVGAAGVLSFFNQWRPVAIVGPSMAPTLEHGDRVLVSLYHPQNPLPERDSIVLVSREGHWSVKRLVALPGDLIEVREGYIWINGQPSPRAHQAHLDTSWYPPRGRVPTHSVFLLGDNQSQSADSRIWGCLTRNAIVGIVRLRYWP